jgi:hypothetical protein
MIAVIERRTPLEPRRRDELGVMSWEAFVVGTWRGLFAQARARLRRDRVKWGPTGASGRLHGADDAHQTAGSSALQAPHQTHMNRWSPLSRG